jgi:Zn-finger nucleic acid-binding protein
MDLSCPKCQAPMRSYERSGVTVDQCTECRGIFLDRGELERLVDADTRYHGDGAAAVPPPTQQPQQGYQQPSYGGHQQQGGQYGQKPYKKKKSSFFEELFD